MRSISDTLARLSRLRHYAAAATHPASDQLTELCDFGSNPGSLRCFIHAPTRLRAETALVVVLHGCTQTAAAYDHGSGWSDLAEQEGFVVLFPEQQRQNNANLCFNWFNSSDIARGAGEAFSILQMVNAAKRKLAIDPTTVFITGLSAGGAMANVMLATYPEVFAGGAIVAGLPYGSARTIPEAFDRMRGHGGLGYAALTELVRKASSHCGPWPTVSVWHGDADKTVSPSNAEAVVAQWRGLHGVGGTPVNTTMANGGRRRQWRDAAGRTVVEHIEIAGMGHGTPLKTTGEHACGSAGPFMLDVGISSTVEIARSWGLLDHGGPAGVQGPRAKVAANDAPARELAPMTNNAIFERVVPSAPYAVTGPGEIIERALRKAGLMR